MTRKSIHTVPNGRGGWTNKTAGASRGVGSFSTKAAAQKQGRTAAKKAGAEHVIHNLNGQIGSKNAYPRSSDPRSSKG
jgi:hypothetical protein